MKTFYVMYLDLEGDLCHVRIEAFNKEDAAFLGRIQLAIAEIARKLNLTENGFRVINNCGKDAKQSVPHIHYHILAGGDMGERIV